MRRGWQVTSLLFLLLSLATAALSLESPLLDALGPGPGFFPFWLALIGTALSMCLLVQVTRGAAAVAMGSIRPRPEGLGRVLRVLVGLAAVVALLDPVGFRLTALAFCAYLLISLGIRRWWLVGLVALAGSFGVFHVFYHWLKVPLPVGGLGV